MKIATPRPRQLLTAFLIIGSLVTVAALETSADDWPRWRGAQHNDTSAETDLLESWPEDGPKQLWVNKASGLGYAGVSIAGDSLYTMGLEDGAEFALCLNAETGKENWRTNIGTQFKNNWGDGPRTTPTIDGDHVYFITGKGTLACLKAADGSEVWKREMTKLGGAIPFWGYSESPLVDGDRVVCTPCGPGTGAMVALDKTDGKVLWKSEDYKVGNDENKSYSSIVPADIDGKRQYIQLTMKNLIGVSAETGELLWKSSWPGAVAVIPSPIVDGNRVYITSGYGVGSKMVEVKDSQQVEDIWTNKVMKNHHGGVVMVGDHFYGYSDKGGWLCQDKKTGEMVWNNKKIKKGAVAFADGLFYHVQERDGQVLLIKADAEGMEEMGRFKISPQTDRRASRGMIWMHPVIADGKLYLRDQELIHCYDIRESK